MYSQVVALIGIGCAFGVSLLIAIVFLVLYTRLKIKDDTNIRRRVIAAKPIEAKAPLIVYNPPEPIEDVIEPIPVMPPPPPPVIYPAPIPIEIPAPAPPPPAPEPRIIMEPVPQPLPPPPPREPEVVVHEIIHRYEPAPAPPPPPPPQPRIARRQSWGGPQEPEDDWVLVKKIKKSGKSAKVSKASEESTDESSDEEDEVKVKHRHKKRLNKYDLATNIVPVMGLRQQPQMFSTAGAGGVVLTQPSSVMAPTFVNPTSLVTQPMMTSAALPTYMPVFTVPR